MRRGDRPSWTISIGSIFATGHFLISSFWFTSCSFEVTHNKTTRLHTSLFSFDDGEGDEGHEGDEEERDREGEAREDGCVPWDQVEDYERAEEGRFDEEQEREDREP